MYTGNIKYLIFYQKKIQNCIWKFIFKTSKKRVFNVKDIEAILKWRQPIIDAGMHVFALYWSVVRLECLLNLKVLL